MATIVEGVDFDTVAREWRCKWSGGNDKKSLAEAQTALNEVLADVKAVDGFKKVDRVVCGGCLDFKVSNVWSFKTAASMRKQSRNSTESNFHLYVERTLGNYVTTSWREVCGLGSQWFCTRRNFLEETRIY